MALSMATFVSPSQQWGMGNGTIDVNDDLTVSWKVNGSSAMVAYQIDISQNDAQSTPLYSTGRVGLSTPFYGTDGSGNVQYFSTTISSTTLLNSGLVNGGNYKLSITQWWSSTQFIRQGSAAAFITRDKPRVTLSVPSTISTRSYTFTGKYSQRQGDGLNWVRWQLSYASDISDPIADTGNIYGTGELSFSYDGFFAGEDGSGMRYAINCTVQTANGEEMSSGWKIFTVRYAVATSSGMVVAENICNNSAVRLSWTGLTEIPGVASGSYTASNGLLQLPAGSSVTWATVNGEDMNFEAPWSLFWSGQLRGASVDIFTVAQASGNVVFSYNVASSTLSLSTGSTVRATVTGVPAQAKVNAILHPKGLMICYWTESGGLTPSEALTPSATLTPSNGTSGTKTQVSRSFTYTQENVSGVTLAGPQNCYYIQLIAGTYSNAQRTAIIYNNNYKPVFDESTYLMSVFASGISAGSLSPDGDVVTGFAIYRQEGGGDLLHLTDVPVTTKSVFDYGARSQQPYVYYAFPIGNGSYNASAMVSPTITPMWWNWTLFSCSRRADGSYAVNAKFEFSSNITSGAISNNNRPAVENNFTRYPTVMRAPQNYQSGTLSALIGGIVRDANGLPQYADSIALRDAIWALSTTTDTLFLKNRKGDLLQIMVSDAITMTTADQWRNQAQTMALPWVEVASAEKAVLVNTISSLACSAFDVASQTLFVTSEGGVEDECELGAGGGSCTTLTVSGTTAVVSNAPPVVDGVLTLNG